MLHIGGVDGSRVALARCDAAAFLNRAMCSRCSAVSCRPNASKAAIRSFARTWTVDLKDRHIRVNVISPGTIDTGIFVGVPKEVKDQFVSIIPMGRIGQPHEIAAAALFLASDDSSFVTGIELFVDDGTAQI
jgi:NAD(P)-dependent dehydrogenase (short-subunit alcohol dehydrogenase family)